MIDDEIVVALLREHEVETEKALAGKDATIRNLRAHVERLHQTLERTREQAQKAVAAIGRVKNLAELDPDHYRQVSDILREIR